MKRVGVLFAALGMLAFSNAGAVTISISSNFNGTDLCSGSSCNFVWYHGHLTAFPDIEGTLFFTNQSVFHEPTMQSYSLPDALVTFVAGAGTATSIYNSAVDRWETTIYLDSNSNDPFITGLGVLPTIELSGTDVTWSGDVAATEGLLGESYNWQWGAAAYTSLDMAVLEVAPIDGYDCGSGEMAGNVHSGTPCTYTEFVTGGARGGGGSNFTGSNSGTDSFVIDTVVPVPAAVWLFGSGLLGLAGLSRRKRS